MTGESKSLSLRGSATKSQLNTKTGSAREIAICDEEQRLYLMDGITPGGKPCAMMSDIPPLTAQDIADKTTKKGLISAKQLIELAEENANSQLEIIWEGSSVANIEILHDVMNKYKGFYVVGAHEIEIFSYIPFPQFLFDVDPGGYGERQIGGTFCGLYYNAYAHIHMTKLNYDTIPSELPKYYFSVLSNVTSNGITRENIRKIIGVLK